MHISLQPSKTAPCITEGGGIVKMNCFGCASHLLLLPLLPLLLLFSPPSCDGFMSSGAAFVNMIPPHTAVRPCTRSRTQQQARTPFAVLLNSNSNSNSNNPTDALVGQEKQFVSPHMGKRNQAKGINWRRSRRLYCTMTAEASADARSVRWAGRVQKWCDYGTSAFPLWVLGAAVMGLRRPAALAWIRGDLITAALATTMVCMGMTLRVDDFTAIAQRPRPVIAGVAAQFTIMPCLGFLTARLFKLPPALAAGVTLVGCCPGGTASNLVTLIANGDVALSVAMTSVSTLLAAAVTGPLTKVLVGSLMDISAVTLMKATAQVVFLPVALGLLLNTYAEGFTRRLSPYTPLLCVALVALICGSVVAANSAVLLRSGAALVGAVLTLHGGGFALAYGGMRKLGFTEQEARTASIEVGMQNSALAVVLAQRGLSDPLSAIPGAVSATCHSLIGSALAAYWRTGDRGLIGRGVGVEGQGVIGDDGDNCSNDDGGALLKT